MLKAGNAHARGLAPSAAMLLTALIIPATVAVAYGTCAVMDAQDFLPDFALCWRRSYPALGMPTPCAGRTKLVFGPRRHGRGSSGRAASSLWRDSHRPNAAAGTAEASSGSLAIAWGGGMPPTPTGNLRPAAIVTKFLSPTRD